MSRYDRMAGRRKYPGRKKRSPAIVQYVAEEKINATELVCAGSRINGVVKSAISPEILAKTEGMGWHQRIARIHAITGIPFTELSRTLADDTKSN